MGSSVRLYTILCLWITFGLKIFFQAVPFGTTCFFGAFFTAPCVILFICCQFLLQECERSKARCFLQGYERNLVDRSTLFGMNLKPFAQMRGIVDRNRRMTVNQTAKEYLLG